ncbi:hypothetical protein [Streptomyces collinus]|uniref:hypothetical protein n=1 Tax=Streptomyces collinus TaxID=42684 RepID=UPI0039810526
MASVSENGEEDSTAHTRRPRSRLYEYMDDVDMDRNVPVPAEEVPSPAPEEPQDSQDPQDPEVAAVRARFAELLAEFRRTPVLVPLGDGPGPVHERGMLTAHWNGVRFILAFSDEQALARYARERGAFAREWTYQTVLGARLLDVAVPAAGVPCGVALDCADGPDGMAFPPVRGIVPDEAALDFEAGDEA